MKRTAVLVAFVVSLAAVIGGSTPATLGAASQPDALTRLRTALGGDRAISAVHSIRMLGTVKREPHNDHVEIKMELPDRFFRTDRYVVTPRQPGVGTPGSRDRYELNIQPTRPVTVGFIGEEVGIIRTNVVDVDPGMTRSGFDGLTVIPSEIRLAVLERPDRIAHMLGVAKTRFAEFVLPLLAGTASAYSVSAASEGHSIIFRGTDARSWQIDLDPATDLPRRMSWTSALPPQAWPGTREPYNQVDFSDFKIVGGLRWPHRWIKTSNGSVVEDTTIDRYELNVSLKFPK